MPPRTRYELTDAGVALRGVIEAIDTWARQHMRRCRADSVAAAEAPEPVVVRRRP
jgi:DNA-binding HxlR family transcriptional regulator